MSHSRKNCKAWFMETVTYAGNDKIHISAFEKVHDCAKS